MWPFANYTQDSVVSASSFIESSLSSLGDTHLAINDGKYTRLSRKQFMKLADAYVPDMTNSYKADLFDCDDAARVAMSEMIKAAQVIGVKAPLAFGTISYNKKDGVGHMVNFAFTAEGDIIYFEPQQRKWLDNLTDMERITDVQL